MGRATRQQLIGNGVRAPLFERERELAELDRLLDSAAHGAGQVALVEGPAGIGKSRLLEAVADRATARGFTVLRASGGQLERELGWAVVRELFERGLRQIVPREREAVLSGAAALSRPILWSGPGAEPANVAEGEAALASALHGLYWLCANLAERAPLALLLDDAHWTDEASLRFLAYLAQRVGDLPVCLVLTARSEDRGEAPRPLESIAAHAGVVRPEPLSEGATGAVASALLGRDPDPGFTEAAHEVTAGNPFLLHELLVQLSRERVEPSPASVPRLRDARPEAIARAVLLRFASLPPAAQTIARSVSVLGKETTLALAAELAELSRNDAAQATDQLAAAEVLAPGTPLRFVHPIVRGIVYEETRPAARAGMHARAAGLLRDTGAPAEEAAAHLLAAEPGAAPHAIEILRQGASSALSSGVPALAVDLLRRALAEGATSDQRATLLVELSHVEGLTGSPEAPARLTEALDLVRDPTERATILLRLGTALYAAGSLDEAAEAFAQGERQRGAEESVRVELRAARYGISGLLRTVDAHEAEDAIAPAGSPSSAAARNALTELAVAEVYTIGSHEEARRLAAEALGNGTMVEEQGVSLTFSMAVSCLFWSDAFEEAEREIEAALERARRDGDFLTAAYVLFGRAQPRYWRGLLSEAAADAAAAVEAWRGGASMRLPLAGYWHAVSLIELDELDQAERTLTDSTPASDTPIEFACWRTGRGLLELARGRADEAWEELAAVAEIAATIAYLNNPTVLPWRASAALAASRIGEQAIATELSGEALDLARRFGAPRQIGVALRAAGLVERGSRGLEMLAESVGTLEGSAARLDLCRSRVELGAALRRANRRREARDELRRGLELAHQLGARLLERRAREELAASGARLKRVELTGPESLTPSERRIAELATGGDTNREIAQQLFLSLRTVETHLTHAYQKLDISSRGELGEALQGAERSV
ncbi:MAG: ATP-binding protein [Solirubrobacterales bacterium]